MRRSDAAKLSHPRPMSSRLRSDIFVAALIRQAGSAGAFAALRRRGAPEAGAIFVKIDRLDGTAALYGPAPQSEIGDDGMHRFRLLQDQDWVSTGDVELRIQRELKFDPDLWFVEIEDRAGRPFIEAI